MKNKMKMKRLIFFTLVTGLIIFLNCAGQNNTDENQKDAYVEEIEFRLLKIEDDILALRERADNELTKKKAEFERQIDSLSRKQNAAKAKLAELKGAKARNWEDLQSEMEIFMTELDSLTLATRDW